MAGIFQIALPAVIYEEPWAALDASIYCFFQTTIAQTEIAERLSQARLRIIRDQPAAGLSIWHIYQEQTEVAQIRLQMVMIEQTLVQVFFKKEGDSDIDFPRLNLSVAIFGIFINLHNSFLQEIAKYPRFRPGQNTQTTNEIDIARAIEALPPPKRGRGAPPDPDNEWARDEIRLGGDRAEVFQGYLQRQKIDPKDKRAVSQARGRFKKATQGLQSREGNK